LGEFVIQKQKLNGTFIDLYGLLSQAATPSDARGAGCFERALVDRTGATQSAIAARGRGC
jgi:hypothetical protein